MIDKTSNEDFLHPQPGWCHFSEAIVIYIYIYTYKFFHLRHYHYLCLYMSILVGMGFCFLRAVSM